MKENPLGALLAGILVLAAVASAALSVFFVNSVRQLQRLQVQSAMITQRRSVANALAAEALAYSKRHADIDPILQAVGILPQTNAAAAVPKH